MSRCPRGRRDRGVLDARRGAAVPPLRSRSSAPQGGPAAGIGLLTCSAADAAGCLRGPGARRFFLSPWSRSRGRAVWSMLGGVRRFLSCGRGRGAGRLLPSRAAGVVLLRVDGGVGRFGRAGADSGRSGGRGGLRGSVFWGCLRGGVSRCPRGRRDRVVLDAGRGCGRFLRCPARWSGGCVRGVRCAAAGARGGRCSSRYSVLT